MFSVIFDMDGTLLDTQRICVPAWDWAGELQGIKNMGESIYSVCGMNEIGWTNFIVNKYKNLNVNKFKADMREYIIKNGTVTLKKGAKELLDFLRDNGIKIALASGSSRESVQHHLNAVDVSDYFCVTVCGKEVKNGKPAPDIFIKTAELMQTDCKDCFVFEDSSNGILAGYNAGMKCIGIPDLMDFPAEVKEKMFCQLESLDQAIDVFKNLL